MKYRPLISIISIVLILLGFRSSYAANSIPTQNEPAAAAPSAGRVFRIGYLHFDPEAQLRPGVFYSLRDFLTSQTDFQREMRAAGLEDVALLSSDSHEHLIERMSHNEFDLVFCSAKDFVSQNGNYNVIYQLKRSNDRFDPRGQRVFHYGIIFVNNRSPLFTAELSPKKLQDYFLKCDRIALVSSFSAAGYDYPLLKISETTSGTLPKSIMFCQSSEEVVKNVINGVSDIGACDSGVIEKVLRINGLQQDRSQLVRTILETAVIPTDPVLLQQNWEPAKSPFIQELLNGLRQFFHPSETAPDLPRLERSSNDKFDDLRQNVELLRESRQAP
jgi:ABC-type phosphate/phosphonate transport system substrate-binding protein